MLDEHAFDEILKLAFLIRERDLEVGLLEDLEPPRYVGDVGVSFSSKSIDDAAPAWNASFHAALRRSHYKRMLSGRRRTFVEAWRAPGGAMVHIESDGTYTRLLALDYTFMTRLFGRPIPLTSKGHLFPTSWVWYAKVLEDAPGVEFGLREG